MLPTHKALPRNLSANSTARNVACMYIGTYAYAYSWNQEKIYRFYHKKWSILSLNWDKYFALYWCFCVRISSILLLIKWSEMDPNAGCEATDLDWDFWPSQLQFYPGVALITLLTYPVNIRGHNDGFPRNTAMKNTFPFKRRATAVLNSIDRIKFDFSTAVVRRLKPSRATAV